MSRLVIETRCVHDWRTRLADPEKQWRRRFSAFETAVAWEAAQSEPSGIPQTVLQLLEQQKALLPDPQLIVGIAEHKVNLMHGKNPSQNDVWALVRVGQELLSMAIEAKAGESFGELVSVWRAEQQVNSEKPKRLAYLKDVLGIPNEDVDNVRYQLLHRTASALIEAKRVGAKHAAMIVQSFNNPDRKPNSEDQLAAFQVFTGKFGIKVGENQLSLAKNYDGIRLYLGWVTCEPATDAQVAARM